MAPKLDPILFEHKGIGRALEHERFVVPLNQRNYAWEDDHVTDLLQDFHGAIANNQPRYFLGAILLAPNEEGHLEVCDGQQRLATTTIILAAIRDYFAERGDSRMVQSIENDFLFKIDRGSSGVLPHLTLNADDAEFFRKRILASFGSKERDVEPRLNSHRKIVQAAALAHSHIRKLVADHNEENKVAVLKKWINYIEDSVQVILLRMPEDLDVFLMFETQNDRGIDTSIADNLKNYLFKKAGKNRISEAQQKWAQMGSVLETHGIPQITVTFIRHMLITMHGHTRQKDVFKRVQGAITDEHRAIEFLEELASSADDYAAMLNPTHNKWSVYGESTRCHLRTIHQDLGVSQIHPLMFAVVKNFSIEEAKRALKCFVSWSVRFLVVGGRGGLLDENYAKAAHRIGKGEIKTATELARELDEIIPENATFEVAFAEARVSQSRLARYYLRVLERQKANDPEPEFLPNDDQAMITLEHVLPEHPDKNWPDIEPEVAEAYCRRIGNLALISHKRNSLAGNAPFHQKRAVLSGSSYYFTNSIAKYSKWGVEEITERQKELANLAVQAWPRRP